MPSGVPHVAPGAQDAAGAAPASMAELREELRERDDEIGELRNALAAYRSLGVEQAATIKEQAAMIEKLAAEVKSHEDAAAELDDPRERARSMERVRTQIAQLEETVEMRGRLVEQYLERVEVLQSERFNLQSQLDILRATCEERLQLIEEMKDEFARRSEALHSQRAALESQIEMLQATAAERLAAIEQVTRELEERTRSLHSERAGLRSQIDVLNAALRERLALIETLSAELQVQRQAAAERLEIIARLESSLQQSGIRRRIKRLLGG